MSAVFPELDAVRVEVSAATRERHLSAIETALASTRPRRGRRFRLMAIATAILMLLPVIALAAERTGPGDLLYPVRQVFERVADVIGAQPPDGSPSVSPGGASTIPLETSTTTTDRVTSTVREVAPRDRASSPGPETDHTTVDEDVRTTDTTAADDDRMPAGSTEPGRDAAGTVDTGDDVRTEPDRP